MLHVLGLILPYDLFYVTIGASCSRSSLSTYYKHHNLWRLRPGPAGCLLSSFCCIYLSCCPMYFAAYVLLKCHTHLQEGCECREHTKLALLEAGQTPTAQAGALEASARAPFRCTLCSPLPPSATARRLFHFSTDLRGRSNSTSRS